MTRHILQAATQTQGSQNTDKQRLKEARTAMVQPSNKGKELQFFPKGYGRSSEPCPWSCCADTETPQQVEEVNYMATRL